ncbi:MAG: metallophosphoesterase [Acidobacteria bacterium]|nr:metallophosphoesterase [Acidobacteriota bacterium]
MRIVALSDQHGFLPDIPPCDLLIVAGDICPDRFGPFVARHDPHQQKAWFDQKVRPWLANAPATHKILTWGNHDWCGQACSFRSDSPKHARSTDMQILVDEETTMPVPGAGQISVWGTPWSNTFLQWAFMKEAGDLEPIYAAIPFGIDILVSHQPPCGYGDRAFDLDAGQLRHVGAASGGREGPAQDRDLWPRSWWLRSIRASRNPHPQREPRRRAVQACASANSH